MRIIINSIRDLQNLKSDYYKRKILDEEGERNGNF